MSDAKAQRKLTANACLYRNLAVREPRLFLQRNLNTVLDAHEYLLAKESEAAMPYEAMIANERRAAGWDFPTKEMLQDFARGQKPVLKIEHLQLRLPGSKGSGVAASRQIRSGDVKLDWLPDPRDGFRLPCQVLVTVFDTRTTSKRETFRDTRRCVVVQRTDDGGKHYFDVELADSILIELDKLFVETESGANGSRHWKRTVTAKYSLEVTIQCQESEQSAELLSRLESRHVDHYKGAPMNEGKVRAVWEDLPECPPTGRLLPLKRAHGHKALQLRYGMELSMGWARRKDSPLELYNRSRRPQSQQLPTPSASDHQEECAVKVKQYVVRYVRHVGVETWSRVREDLGCLFCANAAREGRADMYTSKSAMKTPATTIDRLLLHYWSFHGFFECEKTQASVINDGKELIVIEVRPKKRYNAAADSADLLDEDHSWIAPARPFDITAHLAGDERWAGGLPPKEPDRRGRRPRKDAEKSEEGSVAASSTVKKQKSLAEVVDLPELKRKKYGDPEMGRVPFYHSSSKAPVRPGEELSESEDDLSDDRLLHSQRRNFVEHGLPPAARSFHEAFNQHLDVEHPSGRVSTRDAIVRFARKQQGLSRSEEWLGAFETKLKQLREHGVIDAEVVTYCLDAAAPRDCTQEIDGVKHDMNAIDTEDAVIQDADKPEKNGQDTPRANGKLAKHPSPQLNDSPRVKKPHRWSGGGAEKDIIRTGHAQVTGSEPLGKPSPMLKSPDNLSRARTTTPSRTSRQRMIFVGGKFVEYEGLAGKRRESEAALETNGSLDSVHCGTEREGPVSSATGPAANGVRSGGHEHGVPAGPMQNGLAVQSKPGADDEMKSSFDSHHSIVPRKRACTCGSVAEGVRRSIACDNPRCVHGNFHLACVGLERRQPGWRCEACCASVR